MKFRKVALLLVMTVFLYTPSARGFYRTINVDGEVGDWEGVPVLVTDPQEGAPPLSHPAEDIKAVFAANDMENLYFWMEIYPEVLPVSVELNGDYFYVYYRFYLDTIPGQGDSFYGGADYYIEHRKQVSGVFLRNIEENVLLWEWDPSHGHWVHKECPGLRGASSEYDIEVSVPWDCIGGRQCFEALFYTTSDINASDWAPDRENGTPVTVGFCPSEPMEPVGGALLASGISAQLLAAMTIGVAVVTALITVKSFSRSKTRPFF